MTASAAPAPQHPPPADTAKGPGLSWGLCVSTYNRGEMLRDCVRHALASSLPPSEIVIVDASADWQDNHRGIQDLIAQSGAECPLRYEEAARKSLTVQRNQCVALARADILFMIDDDAMLHPDAAERMMEFYRADSQGRLAALSLRNDPLPEAAPSAARIKQRNRAAGLVTTQPPTVRRGIEFAMRHHLMIPADKRFVTYDRPEIRWQGDETLPPGLVRRHFITGFALTVRRSVAAREPFDEGLVGNCMAEDLDASYRFGRHGLIAIAPDACIHHMEAAAGRDKRRVNTALAILNIGYFVRRNSTRQARDIGRYVWWWLRMTLAELPKDIAGGRWSLPQFRGALLAGRRFPVLLWQPRAGLSHWYQDEQIRIATGTGPGHDRQGKTAPDQGANG